MADFTQTIFISLDNIADYDVLLKKYISDEDKAIDAKSLKSISINPDTHKIFFYREEDPVSENAIPAYTVDLSGYDDAIEQINTILEQLIAKIGDIPQDKTLISFINEVYAKSIINESAISGINDENTGIYRKSKDYVDYLVGAIPLITDENNNIVPAANTVIEYIKKEIASAKSDSSIQKERLDTLIGDDVSKSVRKIANEELAAQLLTGKADADFKTLKELAAWLEDHPEEVSAINLSIQNILKIIGTIPTDGSSDTPVSENIVKYIQKLVQAEEDRAINIEMDYNSRIQEIESALSDTGSVNNKISEAINALDYTYDGIDADIVVGVSQADGKISVEKANIVFATEDQIKELFSN